MRLKAEKENAIKVTAWFKDFEGDVQRWKSSFYEIWRYQLTYSFAYKISLQESNRDGVYIMIYTDDSYINQLLDTMEVFGYQNIHTENTKVAIAYDVDYESDLVVIE